jgi:hypothetical protein
MSYFPTDVSADLLCCEPFASLIRNHRSQMTQGIIPTSRRTQRQILTNTSPHLPLRLNPIMRVTNLNRIRPTSPTPPIPTNPIPLHRVRARILLLTTLLENRQRALCQLTGHNVSLLPAIEPQLT